MKPLLTICCAILAIVNLSFAESSDQQTAVNAELLKELKALEAKVASLEKRLERYENGEVQSEKAAAAGTTVSVAVTASSANGATSPLRCSALAANTLTAAVST